MAVGGFIGHVYLSRLLERFDTTKLAKKFPQTVFILVMVIAFSCALVAELIGLSAIVGSFLAGVALCACVIKHGKNFKEMSILLLRITWRSALFLDALILPDLSGRQALA